MKAGFFALLCALGCHAAAAEDRDAANCGASHHAYNKNLALASMAIILLTSLLGAIIPVMLARVEHKLVGVSIKAGTFAGSGVILATSLIHVLLPAHEHLSSPCAPPAWRGYGAWAFVICTATIALLQILDFYLEAILARYKAQHVHHYHHHGYETLPASECQQRQQQSHKQQQLEGGSCAKHEPCADLECGGHALLADGGALPAAAQQQEQGAGAGPPSLSRAVSLGFAEVAISFHSVVIGVALGLTPEDEFVTLLVALSFHQFLEGFALGSAAVDAGCKTGKACLLASVYSLSTPLGIAIGICIHQSLSGSSGAGALVAEGVLDSVCAGVLLWVVLSGPMNATHACRGWLQQQGWVVQFGCFAAFVGGAAVMALIGKWA